MIIQKLGKKMLKISANFVSQVIKEEKKILIESGRGEKAREEIQ